jgi:hypothetical protein
MERHGDEKIRRILPPIMLQPFYHPFYKKWGQVSFSLIFPTMNRFLERSFIGSQSPCHCKIFSVGCTSTTGMVFDLFREKGDSTNGTKGRFDPADL